MRGSSALPKGVTKEEAEAQMAMIDQANIAHDAKYGIDYSKIEWRSGYEPACPVLQREAIWAYHRQRAERLFIDALRPRV